MAVIEYDKSPNITPEQRLKSLADSVRRAFEEIETQESINAVGSLGDNLNPEPLPIKGGGTGAETAAKARDNLGAASIEDLNELKGAIIRRTKSISGYSFSSKQYRSISIPYDVVEGYIPIIYLVACTSHSAIRVFNFYTSSGNVVFEAVNQNETSLSVNFSIYLMYVKNVLLG